MRIITMYRAAVIAAAVALAGGHAIVLSWERAS